MALAYPEGECFFRRSALKSDHKDYYQADRPDHFYGHFLVEFIWNLPAYTGEEARKKRTHPRSTFKLHDYSQYGFMSSRQGPYIGNWSWMSFTYCAHPYKGKQRRVQHNLCTNRNRLQSQVGGDPMEVRAFSVSRRFAVFALTIDKTYFMIIPMPKRKENWVFIDVGNLCPASYVLPGSSLLTAELVFPPAANGSDPWYLHSCSAAIVGGPSRALHIFARQLGCCRHNNQNALPWRLKDKTREYMEGCTSQKDYRPTRLGHAFSGRKCLWVG